MICKFSYTNSKISGIYKKQIRKDISETEVLKIIPNLFSVGLQNSNNAQGKIHL